MEVLHISDINRRRSAAAVYWCRRFLLGIYPAMHDFLMDMTVLNLQNRTFALIENGSWAVKSGDLMQKFVNDELKNMTVLNERLSLASSLGEDKAVERETLADAILASVQ